MTLDGTSETAAIIVAIAAALAGVAYIYKAVRWVVHLGDKLLDTAGTVDRELTKNHGSSIKDRVTALGDNVSSLDSKADQNADAIANVSGLVKLIGAEVAHHGQQSRAAMAIYRKALADQGIHLPVAPGEDGLVDDQLDLAHPPTHRGDTP